MQGKILMVDAIATNRIVLKVKLKSAFYDVLQATSQHEATALAQENLPDLIIAAESLPDGGAADLCDALAQNPQTAHIPILATACTRETAVRKDTLRHGVHDILYQPIDETLLLGRVRSLIRASNTASEWQMRGDTCRALGLAEPEEPYAAQASCMLVSNDRALLQTTAAKLRPAISARLSQSQTGTVMRQLAEDSTPDAFVLILPADATAAADELRLISTLRASALARHAGIIVVQTERDTTLGATALDLGADDLMTDGFEPVELSLRIKSVIRRKRMSDQMRATVQSGLKAAVFDPLTGLYNRRYAMPHLENAAGHARTSGRSCAVMAADLDHFKRINDAYGHASGDAVLVEVAKRLRGALRNTDMVARIGGEEFLIIMPNTDLAQAQKAALRICRDISATPFVIPGSRTPITVTISIGMAVSSCDKPEDAPANDIGRALLNEADQALYAAKGRGRNQVKLGRPAA